MRKIILNINDSEVEIGYSVYTDTLIPENKKITEINIESCPEEILNCFGEETIEQMIRKEIQCQIQN